MSRVEVSPAAVRGPADVVARCVVQVDPAREPRGPVVVEVEAPAPVHLLVDAGGRVTWVGGAVEALLERSGGELVGRPAGEVVPLRGAAGALADDVAGVLAGGAAIERRDLRLGGAGDDRQLSARVEAIHGAPGAVVTLDDPGARARASLRRRALEGLERLAALESVEEVARGLVEAAVPALADLALVRVIERDGTVTARTDREPARERTLQVLEDLLPTLALDAKPGASATVLRVERPLLIDDLSAEAAATLTGIDPVGQLVRDLDLRAIAVVPVALRGGVALLVLASTGTRSLHADDLHLAESMARRTALVLDRLWLQRRLRRAVHTRERMLSSVGHDLRNPAAAISMAADILISRLPPGDSGSSLKMIHRAANQINALIQKILDESAADAADVG